MALLKYACFEKEGDGPALHKSSMTSAGYLVSHRYPTGAFNHISLAGKNGLLPGNPFLLMLPSMLLVSLHCGACRCLGGTPVAHRWEYGCQCVAF